MAKAKKKEPREFVVGYKGDRQCVYGPDLAEFPTMGSKARWCDRMTLGTARRRLRQLTTKQAVRIIYRLVPHEVYLKDKTPSASRTAKARKGRK